MISRDSISIESLVTYMLHHNTTMKLQSQWSRWPVGLGFALLIYHGVTETDSGRNGPYEALSDLRVELTVD